MDICVYDTDSNNLMIPCNNGAHLRRPCLQFPCSNMFKCIIGFCLPYRRVCDDIPDCSQGEDEVGCENFTCSGMLQCDGRCIHPSEVCDGIAHCDNGDDESLCQRGPCPAQCKCFAMAMQCIHTNYTDIPQVNTFVLFLDMSHNMLTITNKSLVPFTEITTIKLHNSGVSHICGHHEDLILQMFISSFQRASKLIYLDLSSNNISLIHLLCFSGLSSLRVLFLDNNMIRKNDDGAFVNLKQLQVLNISYNPLHTMDGHPFDGLNSIITLDIRRVESITIISRNLFDDLANLDILIVDDYRFCCFRHAKTCTASSPSLTLS